MNRAALIELYVIILFVESLTYNKTFFYNNLDADQNCVVKFFISCECSRIY